MPNYIARDAVRWRDVENVSKVPYALKLVNICVNVTECTSLLPNFPQVGFSMQPPRVLKDTLHHSYISPSLCGKCFQLYRDNTVVNVYTCTLTNLLLQW